MMFLDCPAYLDQDGAARCGLPAEVRCRFTMRSTDGPLECAMIRCPAGHWFNGAIESLTWDGKRNHDPGTGAVTSRSARDSVRGSHDGRGGGGYALRAFPGEPERTGRRPNTAPAYYLGRPATLWITAMRPRRRRTASRYLMEAAVTGGNPTPGLRRALAQVTPGYRRGAFAPPLPPSMPPGHPINGGHDDFS
jgi:hypothetical protein